MGRSQRRGGRARGVAVGVAGHGLATVAAAGLSSTTCWALPPPFLVPVSAGALQHCGHVILAEPCDLGSTRDPLSLLKAVSLVWGSRHVILAAM